MASKGNLVPGISGVVEKIKTIGGDKVRFIILYGSTAKGEMTELSDIDLAVFYEGDKKERFDFRVTILGRVGNEFDIQTFQDLPLYIRKDIVSYGNVIFYKGYRELFNTFIRTIRDFEHFKPRLNMYYSGLGV
ncbi:MAG: nucleotidyltransferase domain-containing protein [Desulfobacteraceae bacterium]|nr:nucleotidyltransferase domain-containing protein [Desulfobacteraceae bacterium]MBC2719119.1 nucleotidyltransferase domain-containing protein [Desulfobacteraceae bacterium]